MHVRVCLAVMAAGFASILGVTAYGEDRAAPTSSSTFDATAGQLALAYQPAGEDKAPAKDDAKSADTKPPGNGVADAKKTPAAGEKPGVAVSDDPASAAFRAKLEGWKQLLADARQKQFEFKAAKPAEQKDIQKQFDEIKARGIAMQPEIQKAAEVAYLAAPNKDDEVTAFMSSAVTSANAKDDYEEVLRLANLLIEHEFPKKAIYTYAGVAAFNLGDYETAEKDLTIAKEAKAIDATGRAYLGMIDEYKTKWAKEQEIRAAEARSNDLPRVLLKTTKGDIVVELFENEAPNTVANFISLVQKGFYKGSDFHRVLRGFMAQGGSPKGEDDGGPGYTIADECRQDNHRIHFRGTLSMAKTDKPDTGGSQFFLTFVPTPQLDGAHTVFGRVVEGMDVLSQLTRRDPRLKSQDPPDSIVEAKVVRKRSHPYQPKTTSDKDEKAAVDKAAPGKAADEKADSEKAAPSKAAAEKAAPSKAAGAKK